METCELEEPLLSSDGERRKPTEESYTLTDKMKKYYKLCLVVVAALSSLCFLIYKYRYDKLYNVMQVLEVFGTPNDPNCQCKSSSRGLQALTVPAWQAVGPDLSVYSAYCTSVPGGADSSCPLITALAAAVTTNLTDYKCKLWYEGSPRPLEGTFSYQEVSTTSAKGREEGETTNSALPLQLNCETKYPDKQPYGVAFYRGKAVPVTVAVQPIPQPSIPPTLQICILAPTSPEDLGPRLRESLLFHSLVGVKDIIIYSTLLPHSLQKSVAKLMIETDLEVRQHVWNPALPLSLAATWELLTRDCYYQSQHVTNYILLHHNQVLVPLAGESLFQALQLVGLGLDTGPIPVPVHRFCSEYPGQLTPTSAVFPISLLDSTYYNKELSRGLSVDIHHHGKAKLPPASHLPDQLAVHEYGPCNQYDFTEKDESAQYDDTGLQFREQMLALWQKY